MRNRGISGLVILLFALGFAVQACTAPKEHWSDTLAGEIKRIDDAMPGQLGVYVRYLGDGSVARHRTDRDWYLASTIKIPLAIALMQRVETGALSLDDELELSESDFVDGAGDLLWQPPGTRYSLDELNLRSIRDSDSTATDLIIRLLGEEAFNSQISNAMVREGFGPITTILQVRYEAFGEIHPDVEKLSNLDFIELRNEGDVESRYRRLLEILGIEPEQASAKSATEAFERYYSRGLNSGNLESFGVLLERLVRGELLNQTHTRRILEIMESVSTGDRRIKAGLPNGARFAHKTGTQIARACNVGILNPQTPEQAVLVLACAEHYDQIGQAETAFRRLGAALTQAGLVVEDH